MSTEQIPVSLSNEWAGLIGISYQKLMTSAWQLYAPVVAFTVTILAVKAIVKGIERSVGKSCMPKIESAVRTIPHLEESFSFLK